MSDNTTTEIEHRVQTIVDQFAESGIEALAGVRAGDLKRNLESLVAYQVPVDEAERTVVRRMIEEADLDPDELPDDVAQLAGYASSGGRQFERSMIGDIDAEDEWMDLVAEVVDLWEPKSDSIAQVGLLGDESGRIKFVKWANADLPKLEEGEAYAFESVVTDEYEGRFSVNLNSATAISEADQDVNATDGTVVISGTIVDIQDGSGLIKRCPHEDCTRVLQNGRCGEHGQVDGEFDLRIKAILDDGHHSINVLFNEEATEALTGLSLDDAKGMAMDALDTSVVTDEIRDAIFGRMYQLTGPVVGTYFLVDDAEELQDPADGPGIDDPAVVAAYTNRQPAKRVFAQEFNRTIHTFTDSDEERAPVFGLLPTGEAANRVLIVGALIETDDVGSNNEYWRGRIVAASESVYVYAGQYQPEAMAVLKTAKTPAYVAAVGKVRTYETDYGVNVALQPESIALVDEVTRDRWVAETAAHTRERLNAFSAGAGELVEMAQDIYGEDVSAIDEAVAEIMADAEDDGDETEVEDSSMTGTEDAPTV